MRQRGLKPRTVGAIAIVVIAVGCYLGFTKSIPFRSHYEVEAVFRSAATAIKKNAPVRIAGVNVGKVTQVRKGPGNTALVTMRVDERGRPLHADATAKLRPRLFLEGNFFVDVTPGTGGASELRDGARIPLAQTAIPVQVDQVLATLDKSTRTGLQDTIRGLSTALDDGGAEALNASFEPMAGAFTGTSRVFEALRGQRPGDLPRFVRRTEVIASALASRDAQLADLITGFSRTVTALAASRDDLVDTLRALDTTVSTARPALAELRVALPAVDRFANALRPGLRAAPAAIDDLRPFVRETSMLLRPAELPALTRALRPGTQALRDVTPGLRDVLGRAQPIAACVSTTLVPTLNDTIDDGALSTGDPVWHELARFGVGLAAAAGNFDANGTNIRYFGGGGENLISTRIPGVDALYSLTERPLLGARPRYQPGVRPPARPNVPCESQGPADLKADAMPAPRQRRIEQPAAERRTIVSDAVERLQRLSARGGLKRAFERERQP